MSCQNKMQVMCHASQLKYVVVVNHYNQDLHVLESVHVRQATTS